MSVKINLLCMCPQVYFLSNFDGVGSFETMEMAFFENACD